MDAVQKSLQKIRTEAILKSNKIIADAKQSRVLPSRDVDVSDKLSQIVDHVKNSLATNVPDKVVDAFAALTKELKNTASKIEKKSIPFVQPIVPVYPNNCKLFCLNPTVYTDRNKRYKSGVLVIQEPPQIRNIFTSSKKIIKLPFPYMVYLIGFDLYESGNKPFMNDKFGVMFSKETLKSMKDKVYDCHLPHVYGKIHVCQPGTKGEHETLIQLTSSCIQTFWSSSFNYPFTNEYHFDFPDNKSVKSLLDWSNLSKDPLQILKANFNQPETLESVIKNAISENPRSSESYLLAQNLVAEHTKNIYNCSLDATQSIVKLIESTIDEILKTTAVSDLQP